MHRLLAKQMAALGYSGNENGICAGIAEMGIQAFLCGRAEFAKFIERVNKLYLYL